MRNRTLARSLHRDDRGFTMIEMVLVVSIVMIITSIIGPTFRMTPTRQVENTAQMLAAHLELARTEALAKRRMVRVDFDIVAGTYTAYLDADGNGVIAGSAAEAEAFPAFGTRRLENLLVFGQGSALDLPGDTVGGAVTLAASRVSFDRQGIPTPWGSMGTIYITHSRDNTAVAAVSVAPSGAFEAWRWWPDPGVWR